MNYLLSIALLFFPLVSMAEEGCVDDSYLYTIVESSHVTNGVISIKISFNEPIEIVQYKIDDNTLFIKDCFTTSGDSLSVEDIIFKQEDNGVRILAPQGHKLKVNQKGVYLHLTFSKTP